MTNSLKQWCQLLRPRQWFKNIFIFAGVIFSRQWSYPYPILNVLIVFIAFCGITSSVYIINDFCDRHHDANNPLKKHRPLATKSISIQSALTGAFILFLLGIGLAYYASTTAALLGLSYFFLNLAYSLWLKNIVFLDVAAISSGFILRLLAGTWGVNIEPSHWLLICGGLLTLFLGFSKRYAEKKLALSAQRPILQYYSTKVLYALMLITALCTIFVYLAYTANQFSLAHLNLFYTIPWVLLGIARYLFLVTHSKKSTPFGIDISDDVLHDKYLAFIIIAWVITVIISLNFQEISVCLPTQQLIQSHSH